MVDERHRATPMPPALLLARGLPSCDALTGRRKPASRWRASQRFRVNAHANADGGLHATSIAGKTGHATAVEPSRDTLHVKDEGYDAKKHSTAEKVPDLRRLPKRIILVRHGQSLGNVDKTAYSRVPDPDIPLTVLGKEQAQEAGRELLALMGRDAAVAGTKQQKVYFYYSPYRRARETFEAMRRVFEPTGQFLGAQEEVQIREQDFGNFQDLIGLDKLAEERLRFSRFFYRFPNGESGADVFDRITIFEDHLIRDLNAGRFSQSTNLVLVTHGLTLRIFLMKWFHWTVRQFELVYNPANSQPIILDLIPSTLGQKVHTKQLYQINEESKVILKGCTDDMCSTALPEYKPEEDPDEEARPSAASAEVSNFLDSLDGPPSESGYSYF